MRDGAAPAADFVQASAVEAAGAGMLILGRSGAGKSALALEMIALGCRLIADDLVRLGAEDGRLLAEAPPAAARRIEARGIGVLRLPAASVAPGKTPLALVLDLSATETDRIPLRRWWIRSGVSTPLLRRPDPLRPAAFLAALSAGGPLDPDEPV